MCSHKPWAYSLCHNRDSFSSQTPLVLLLTDFLHNYEYDHRRTCSLTSVACVSTVRPILPSSSSCLLQVLYNAPCCWSPWQPRVLSSCHSASTSYMPTVRCCLPVWCLRNQCSILLCLLWMLSQQPSLLVYVHLRTFHAASLPTPLCIYPVCSHVVSPAPYHMLHQ